MEATTEVGWSAPGAAVGLASERLWFQERCKLNNRYSILIHRKGKQIRIALTDRNQHDDAAIDHGATIRTLTTFSDHRAVLVVGLLSAHQDPVAFISLLVHPVELGDGREIDLDEAPGDRIVAAFRDEGAKADAA